MEKQRARSQQEKEFRAIGIINSAKDLYLNNPTQFPEVSKIINKAGMAKGSFYNYFDSKEEIYLEILKREYKNWFYNFGTEQLAANDYWAMFKPLISNPLFLRLSIHGQLKDSESISIEKRFEFQEFLNSHIDILAEKLSKEFKHSKVELKQNILQSLSLIIGHQLYTKESEFISSINSGLSKIWTI